MATAGRREPKRDVFGGREALCDRVVGTSGVEGFCVLVWEDRSAGRGECFRDVLWMSEELEGEITARSIVTIKGAIESDHRKRVVKKLQVHETYVLPITDARETHRAFNLGDRFAAADRGDLSNDRQSRMGR
jgi:hypothetical protein